jgi:Xaa-Pro aminopeptidase
MDFDLTGIQAELQKRGLDGWLLCDHHHRDPLAYRVLGLEAAMVTRRWFYFIPAQGEPQKLSHRIEAARLNSLPGEQRHYSAWTELREHLGAMLGAAKTIAMQYSPQNNIPYVSLVDGGTLELVRELGKEVVTSADLIQRFDARWTHDQHRMHLEAGRMIDEVMAQSFARIGDHVREGKGLTEYALQQWILEQFAGRGLVTDDPPIVGVNQHSGDPHYEPSASGSSSIKAGDWVLLDMWAKFRKPDATYYDITWVGYIGGEAPEKHQAVFSVVREARDAAVQFIADAVRNGRTIHGYEVDDVARGVIRQHGYGDSFIHRTGHSLGEEVHSTGVNIDNLETHDEREIIPSVCFSIEPGIYLPEFGVRLEVNVYVGSDEAGTTGAVQKEIVRIQ